jgi:hypothetical protein
MRLHAPHHLTGLARYPWGQMLHGSCSETEDEEGDPEAEYTVRPQNPFYQRGVKAVTLVSGSS